MVRRVDRRARRVEGGVDVGKVCGEGRVGVGGEAGGGGRGGGWWARAGGTRGSRSRRGVSALVLCAGVSSSDTDGAREGSEGVVVEGGTRSSSSYTAVSIASASVYRPLSSE